MLWVTGMQSDHSKVCQLTTTGISAKAFYTGVNEAYLDDSRLKNNAIYRVDYS